MAIGWSGPVKLSTLSARIPKPNPWHGFIEKAFGQVNALPGRSSAGLSTGISGSEIEIRVNDFESFGIPPDHADGSTPAAQLSQDSRETISPVRRGNGCRAGGGAAGDAPGTDERNPAGFEAGVFDDSGDEAVER